MQQKGTGRRSSAQKHEPQVTPLAFFSVSRALLLGLASSVYTLAEILKPFFQETRKFFSHLSRREDHSRIQGVPEHRRRQPGVPMLTGVRLSLLLVMPQPPTSR